MLLGLIQLIPYGNAKNPPVTKAAVWPSAQAQTLAENACNDCHSNLTKSGGRRRSLRRPGWRKLT